jgi:hypothetical protein
MTTREQIHYYILEEDEEKSRLAGMTSEGPVGLRTSWPEDISTRDATIWNRLFTFPKFHLLLK